jgi:hypothetical protein
MITVWTHVNVWKQALYVWLDTGLVLKTNMYGLGFLDYSFPLQANTILNLGIFIYVLIQSSTWGFK